MYYENLITSQLKELEIYNNDEFSHLYSNIKHENLRKIFVTLHGSLIRLFKLMNERLPTGEIENHFWADSSRELIKIINVTQSLKRGLENSEFSFAIDEYYEGVINKCSGFLTNSGGSAIPKNTEKIILYYEIPIFSMSTILTVANPTNKFNAELKLVGSGSYANVYRYKDKFYNKHFIVKRAQKNLSPKELSRFRTEFEEMKRLNSPYIVEVHTYNSDRHEYIMENMDFTLNDFILKGNELNCNIRKNICLQIFKAFFYIHSKGYLHRDISPKNILLKKYEDVLVVKVSDFGLVKMPNLEVTSLNTELKGYFNDPSLQIEGFKNYCILHETFALTRLILFVLTGKTNLDEIKNGPLYEFKTKGLNPNKSLRFKNVNEMQTFFVEKISNLIAT